MCASSGGCYALVICENGACRPKTDDRPTSPEWSDRDVMNQLCPETTCPELALVMDLMKPTRRGYGLSGPVLGGALDS
ncbi:uncharacterized protein LOC126560484 [Anopheles maculipalpis]|uniref:uncharacterized protein LOC126560484 n=1 Tax=Anopheles maculipalpis TaxID=1496333 RepID=UPI00215935AB|nr:uncharacterized protein LOC126560484 [Anopheles maculipalpis]